MIRIKHIFHSGFQVELDDKILLIDVFNHLNQFNNQKLYYFSTHSHGDHFSPDAMKLILNNNIQYILSDDIHVEEDVIYMKDGDHIELDGLKITAYGTTDLGISFLIEYHDLTLFHSGDLNWWDWSNEEEEVRNHERDIYFKEIERLKGLDIDYAFVPVDCRLGDSNRLAMDYFIDCLHPKYLIPMHFAHDYMSVRDLKTDTNTQLLIPQKSNSYIL